MIKVLSIFGTRPEAIKMAPVINELDKHPDIFENLVCVTAQHRQMLDQVLGLFKIKPHFDLNIMKEGQDLFDITCNVLLGLKNILKKTRPDIVLVHGDTTTTMAATIAAYYSGMKIGHVEAGLRTHNKLAPFPEEINRRITSVVADIHFAPTHAACENLLQEGLPPNTVHITGNTVVDALLAISNRIDSTPKLVSELESQFSILNNNKKLILITGHRRENFGEGFLNISHALADIAQHREDVELLYPVHLNPNVQQPIKSLLQKYKNIHLIEPVDYVPFVYLMKRSHMIITDSGGVQEEAPSLGKPVLVMRETTERPEALASGTVKLVGANRERIFTETMTLLDNNQEYESMSRAHNPYGDGHAARKIVEALMKL